MDNAPQNATADTRSKKISFLLLFQVIGATFLLIFIALLLNYLNIFRLDFYIPALSTLPRLGPKTVAFNPHQKPTIYQYDQSIPERALPEFLRRVVQPAFLPPSFIVIHKLNENKEQTDTDYTYGTTWTNGDAEFHGFYHFNIGTSDHQDSQVEILLYPGQKTTDAKNLMAKYLQINPNSAKCKIINSDTGMQICEAFSADLFGVKHGYGAVINILNQNRHQDMIFACEIPKESLHSTWLSCTQQYATTGIH